MKWISTAFLIIALPVSMATANEAVIKLTPDEIDWGAANEGPQSVVLYGDPAAQGMPFGIERSRCRRPSFSTQNHYDGLPCSAS
jgi:hypothetical protein